MNSHQDLYSKALIYVAGSLGHELNNQLTLILGNCGMVSMEAPQAKASVGTIEKGARKIWEATDTLVTLARTIGKARAKVEFSKNWAQALRFVKERIEDHGCLAGADADLGELDVYLDPEFLPVALFFSSQALLAEKKSSVHYKILRQNDGHVAIVLRGLAKNIPEHIFAVGSSQHQDIILGIDAVSIGLSAAKAFCHRSHGSFQIQKEGLDEATICLRFPEAQEISSFRKTSE